jgi:hypothetical protein
VVGFERAAHADLQPLPALVHQARGIRIGAGRGCCHEVSISAVVWKALRLAGTDTTRIRAWGRLFTELT